jgi:hypothetical protein
MEDRKKGIGQKYVYHKQGGQIGRVVKQLDSVELMQ